MTNISLREYVHDVENLIARGKPVFAEQHCKHILHYFPKHVKTYRLLGKSCLLTDKSDEAGDIFLRVLSVIPDDFASLVGLGIIAEDHNDLDSAIWYMQISGEVDPSDADIQSEIRRLYSKRDEIIPARSRITRGALIRTYLRSELYTQAISQARSALAEEPHRIDFLLLLARSYYQSGKKMEAAETCTQIIKRLPYCLEANKILFIICSSMNRPVESQLFQKRISEIEPYSAHISKKYPSPSMVPDETILMERLDAPLKEDELYIPNGEEPASELIKLLSSPLAYSDLQEQSKSESLSLPVSAENNGFSQYDLPVSDSKVNAPFIGDISETNLPIQDNQPEKAPDVSQKDETSPDLDQTSLDENGLPEWLQNYSFGSQMSREYTQESKTNNDFIDFLYQGKNKYSDRPVVHKYELPSIRKPEDIPSQVVNQQSTPHPDESFLKETKFMPFSEDDFFNHKSFSVQQGEKQDNNEGSPITSNEIPSEAPVKGEYKFDDIASLQEQIRSILMHENDENDLSMDHLLPDENDEMKNSNDKENQ